MLKWAINEPRQSYLSNTPDHQRMFSMDEFSHLPTSSHLFVRHSIEGVCMEPNKENQITSTPLSSSSTMPSPLRQQAYKNSPRLRKLDSFRDLSDIHPENSQNSTPQRRHITSASAQKVCESRYASTLPTLDVNEYSPSCVLIPGPLLALRGLGIPDAYFEKPRYLTQHDIDGIVVNPQAGQLTELATPQTTRKFPISPRKSLSSSQMDNSALDRMIDAIIASSHKDHKIPIKSSRSAQAASRSCSLSPTYTPAYDPASDLDEIWWNPIITQSSFVATHQDENRSSEHSLRTPTSHKSHINDVTFKRRRQRPVRRKRRLSNFRSTVKKSARKLLRVGSNVSTSMPQLYEDDENETETQHSRTAANVSPDSGHNSSSGDSSKTSEDRNTKELTNKDANELEVTKRRLSFSKIHCN